MQDILRLRFQERDTAFEQSLTTVKQEMSARGLLYSSNTIQRGHEELVAEFIGSRGIIVATYSANLKIDKPNRVSETMIKEAVAHLDIRRDFLERFYQEKMAPITKSLQNKKMLEPYMNLGDVIELNNQELRVEMAEVMDEYVTSQGRTLYHRLRNQFLNRPIIAFGAIVIVTVVLILTFVSAVFAL